MLICADKQLVRKIEKFLDDGINQVPINYKLFCFNNKKGIMGLALLLSIQIGL